MVIEQQVDGEIDAHVGRGVWQGGAGVLWSVGGGVCYHVGDSQGSQTFPKIHPFWRRSASLKVVGPFVDWGGCH